MVAFGDLGVERPEVVQHAQQEEAAGEEIDDAADPLADVQAMRAEDAQERQQQPGHRIVDLAAHETAVGFAIHRGDQEQVDDPANAQQAQREEPDRAGDGFAVVEAVRAEKSEDPEQIAQGFAVGVVDVVVHPGSK